MKYKSNENLLKEICSVVNEYAHFLELFRQEEEISKNRAKGEKPARKAVT